MDLVAYFRVSKNKRYHMQGLQIHTGARNKTCDWRIYAHFSQVLIIIAR